MKKTGLIVPVVCGVLGLCASLPASAALLGSLSFDDPFGTVAGDEVIPMKVTFTYNGSTEDALRPLTLSFTPGGSPPFGIEPGDLPPHSGSEISNVYLNVFFTCGGTFSTTCIESPPYGFHFASAAEDGFANQHDLTMNPGESISFVAGFFTPEPSPAPAGVYKFFNFGLTLNLFSEVPGPLHDQGFDGYSQRIAQTCPTMTDDCAFIREVTAVPLPAAAWLLLSGLGGLGAVVRRRRAGRPA